MGLVWAVIWLYGLRALRKADLKAWRYFWGSGGLFILMMVFIRPLATNSLARIIASMAGIMGNITGMYMAYFKYGVIFIENLTGAITLQIDFECSGILEIMAFVALLAFYQVYTVYERVVIGIAGSMFLMLANAIRIFVICLVIHLHGLSMYHVAHTIIGRLVFYILSIMLYFMVFTKGHIRRQKVGGFSYGNDQ